MSELLPKIWLGRIQKYWDYIKSNDLPNSSSTFKDVYESAEIKNAVAEMENKLNTDDTVLKGLIADTDFVSGYYGTYNVSGVAGEKTLLSPVKVNETDSVIVLHYINNEWKQIENATVEDGYVWGTVDSFSPIAVFTTRRDIELKSDIANNSGSWLVANGNPVIIEGIPNSEDKIAWNRISGKQISVSGASGVIGGSVDGTDIETTSIVIENVNYPTFNVIAGSVLVEDLGYCAKVKTAKATVVNSTVLNITGSFGYIKTENLVLDLTDSTFSNFIGAGQSYIKELKKDVNKVNPTLTSNFVTKNVEMNIKNCNTNLMYCAGNTGYTYTGSVKVSINGGDYKYILACPSNGYLDNCNIEVNNATAKYFQTTNRGEVGRVSAKMNNSNIDKLFVTGDSTDSGVKGIVDCVKINIGRAGTYNLYPGTVNGELITDGTYVESVKISRSATFTENDNIRSILGSKFIIK